MTSAADALAPGLQLLDGRGAVRVPRSRDHLRALLAVEVRQPSDRRCLPCAVHADDKHQRGRLRLRRALVEAPEAPLRRIGRHE